MIQCSFQRHFACGQWRNKERMHFGRRVLYTSKHTVCPTILLANPALTIPSYTIASLIYGHDVIQFGPTMSMQLVAVKPWHLSFVFQNVGWIASTFVCRDKHWLLLLNVQYLQEQNQPSHFYHLPSQTWNKHFKTAFLCTFFGLNF